MFIGQAMDSSRDPLIRFPAGSLVAKFVQREKRFRVEVETGEGRFWVHCNNSGSMLGLLRKGAEVLVSPAQRTGRILPYTLELVCLQGFWVGVNTMTPNRLLRLGWEASAITEAARYDHFRGEARVGESRLDALLTGPDGSLWVEAKNVTLVEDDTAYFPDAVSVRAQKHLRELMDLTRRGARCACFYLIQRPDARCFAPASFIDPAFAELFRQALEVGVEVWPYVADVSPEGIGIGRRLPVARDSR